MRNLKQLQDYLRDVRGKAFPLVVVTFSVLALASEVKAQQNRPLAGSKMVKTVSTTAVKNYPPATVTKSSPPTDRYRIGPGDVLEVRIYKLPDLSRDGLRVEESGTIRMPLINEDIPATCRTEGELAKDIATRYLPLMRNPQVDVFIKEYHSRPVAVIGAVNTPGRFQLQRRIRLLDLLSFAGGPAERAGGNIQVVHSTLYPSCETAQVARKGSPGLNIFKLRDTLAGNARSNPYVQPGDVITVLEFEQVYVIGNVVRPSSIPLKEKITLSQAIAMAGGPLPDSQSDRIHIIRQKPDSNTKEEIFADLRAINKRRVPDIVLQANDIVEIPTASGRRFVRNVLEGVVPSVARFPVRVIR
ncbi:MAG: SLBB domain-containing protein [Pyrinomonadaceae bacterium]